MTQDTVFSINCRGQLHVLRRPWVAGIINVTPDSFYAGSRTMGEAALHERVAQQLDEGADMLDLGAYSSRPGAEDVSVAEEIERLRMGMKVIREHSATIPVSIDTFRSKVARLAIEEMGADMINDISGGEIDKDMFSTVAALQVPYILMHMRGTPQTMQQHCEYEHLIRDIFLYFSQKVDRLHSLGVNDVILDPGFGFAKTLEQNYELMAHLKDFEEFGLPLLVGVSRKSMIFRLLNSEAQAALNGSTVLHTYALLHGAHLLRVHDVKAAVEAVKIVEAIQQGAQSYCSPSSNLLL